MDHARIDDEDFAGRYRAGRLHGPDLEAFETHLIACVRCQDAIEADRALARHLGTWGLLGARQPRVLALAASTAFALVLSGALWVQWQAAESQVANLEQQVARLGAPRADLPVFLFAETRASSRGAARLHLPREAEWFTLEVEVPETGGECCRVRIEATGGRTVWQGPARMIESGGTVRVQLARASLAPGIYELVVSAGEPAVAEVARHRFEVEADADT